MPHLELTGLKCGGLCCYKDNHYLVQLVAMGNHKQYLQEGIPTSTLSCSIYLHWVQSQSGRYSHLTFNLWASKITIILYYMHDHRTYVATALQEDKCLCVPCCKRSSCNTGRTSSLENLPHPYAPLIKQQGK